MTRYWNRARLIYLSILWGYFHVTLAINSNHWHAKPDLYYLALFRKILPTSGLKEGSSREGSMVYKKNQERGTPKACILVLILLETIIWVPALKDLECLFLLQKILKFCDLSIW